MPFHHGGFRDNTQEILVILIRIIGVRLQRTLEGNSNTVRSVSQMTLGVKYKVFLPIWPW